MVDELRVLVEHAGKAPRNGKDRTGKERNGKDRTGKERKGKDPSLHDRSIPKTATKPGAQNSHQFLVLLSERRLLTKILKDE
jgi:hypothetical protein